MDTFRPRRGPPSGMDQKFQPTVLSQQFGDGYKADANVGINYDLRPLSPSWTNLKLADAQYIEDFLGARKGTIQFSWQPYPDRPAGRYKCKDFTSKRKRGNFYDISAEFEQVG